MKQPRQLLMITLLAGILSFFRACHRQRAWGEDRELMLGSLEIPQRKNGFLWQIFTSTLFLVFVVTVAAQEKTLSEVEEAEFELQKWQMRVNDLTGETVADIKNVSAAEQSLYNACLARIWWKTDNDEARVFLKRATQSILAALTGVERPNVDSDLKYSRKALDIVFLLDERTGLEIVGKIDEALKGPEGKYTENEEMAELLASVGSKVAPTNTDLGFSLGRHSLNFGFAYAFPGLVMELNLRNPGLAETLIRDALARTRNNFTNPSYLLVFNLNRYMAEYNRGREFSVPIQRLVLASFAELLNGAAAVEQERPRRCGIAYYASWAIARINEHLPGLALTFRQDLQTCIPYAGSTTQELAKARADENRPDSVDELLRLARESNDRHLKVFYYREALGLLSKEKKFSEMVSVLDGLEGEDLRETAPITWDNWRVGAAFGGALAAFEENDLAQTYRFIDRTPKRLRPLVRSRLVSKESVIENNEFLLENLENMRAEMKSPDFHAQEAPLFYIDLAKLYLRFRPVESGSLFRDAALFINKADSDNPDFTVEKDWAPMQDYVRISSDLLEADELSITYGLREIKSPRSRIRLRLGLLESSLRDLDRAKERLEQLRDSEKKNKSAQPTPPEKVENTEQSDIGSLLNARIENLISEKESEWKLVKNLSSPRSESSYRVWNRLNNEVIVDIQAQDSIEEARSLYEKSKSPLWTPSGTLGREIPDLGDEGAFLRSNDGKPIPSTLNFSVGKFFVIITAETEDVLRFAKHIDEVLRSHR